MKSGTRLRNENELTSIMTSASGENAWGNNKGTNVPIDPNIVPLSAPMTKRDFNSIRACLVPSIY